MSDNYPPQQPEQSTPAAASQQPAPQPFFPPYPQSEAQPAAPSYAQSPYDAPRATEAYGSEMGNATPPPPLPEVLPAEPTVPFGETSAPASAATGAPYGQGYGYGAWNGFPVMAPAPVVRRRPRRWLYAMLGLAFLVMLLVGTGIGVAVANLRGAVGSPNVTIGASNAPVVQNSSGAAGLQQNVESVVTAVQPSVVEITSSGGSSGGEAIGSGDILTANGYIVTNDHVVQGFSSFTVTLSNGKNLPATLRGQDAQDDLAVLKINATNLHPISLANSSKAQVGEFAIAVGNPLGLQQSATFGIVSALNRAASEAPNGPAGELTGLIQTSAPINPGNSGGALVDLNGQLIGIPTLGAVNTQTGTQANGIGYAIPSNRVQYVAQQLIKNGSLTSTGQGFLGIQTQNISAQSGIPGGNGAAQTGVLVAGFANDAAGASPAQQAGVQKGDIITAVDGATITSSSDLATALLNQAPGTKVTLTVVRGSNTQSVKVTLGERPTNLQG